MATEYITFAIFFALSPLGCGKMRHLPWTWRLGEAYEGLPENAWPTEDRPHVKAELNWWS